MLVIAKWTRTNGRRDQRTGQGEQQSLLARASHFRLKQEIHDLRQKIELQSTEYDENQNMFRRRFQDTVSDLTSQVEALSKGKSRFVRTALRTTASDAHTHTSIVHRFRHDKESKTFIVEIEELKNEVDTLAKSRSQAVSMNKELEGRVIEMSSKIDDAIRQLTDANNAKSRLAEENLTYGRRLETLDFELTSLQTVHKRTQGDLEEARLHLESEMAVSMWTLECRCCFSSCSSTLQVNRTLQSTVKTYQMDLESTKLQLDDEAEAKVELQKLLIKLQEETRHFRDRMEKEIESKNEEIEDQRFDTHRELPSHIDRVHLDENSICASAKYKNN